MRSGSLTLMTVHTKEKVQHMTRLRDRTYITSKENLQQRVQEHAGMQQSFQETCNWEVRYKSMQIMEQLMHE